MNNINNIGNISDEKRIIKKAHNIVMQNRKQLNLTGVIRVENFNETTICLETELGQMTVEGEQLHISKLVLETGDMNIDGNINGIFYSLEEVNSNGKKSGGFLSKLLK